MNTPHATTGLLSNSSGLPLVEPDQVCEACGAQGTAGKVVIAAHDKVPESVHRYCVNCWPIESARHRARIRERLRESMELALVDEHDADKRDVDNGDVDTVRAERTQFAASSQAQRELHAFNRVGATRIAAFESATWHLVEETVEKFQELLHMVQSGTVPTVEELEASAREMAQEILAAAATRVGGMPPLVATFLAEFGPDGEFGSPAPKLTPAESRAAIRDAVAAAHASADEVIAAFDQQLETLLKGTPPVSG